MKTILITIQLPDDATGVVSNVQSAPQASQSHAEPPWPQNPPAPYVEPPRPSAVQSAPTCPTHGPGYIKHNSRGLYCARKLPDGQWCPWKP